MTTSLNLKPTPASPKPTPPSLTLVRRIKAPPSKVYAAWTEPAQIARWWGPDRGPVLSAEADVRTGGRFRVVFQTRDGEQHDSGGEYREVVPDQKLVFTWTWTSTPERESQVTLLFKPVDGGTELTLIHERFFDEAVRDSHRVGWSGALDKLDAMFG